MKKLLNPISRLIIFAAAALALLLAPSALMTEQDSGSAQPSAQSCYNGVTLLNPWGRSCTIPGPVNKIRGSAPDANAILACKGIPGCLSWYVNNP
jgi:hypothetical protein